VVETLLGNLYFEAILDEFLRSDVNSIAQVGVEVVEVGDERVKFDILHFNTLVHQVVLVVIMLMVRLVPDEVRQQFLVELVESRIPERSFKVFKSRRVELEIGQRLLGVAEQVTGEHLEGAVVVIVGRVWITLDQIAQNIQTMMREQLDCLTRFLQHYHQPKPKYPELVSYSVRISAVDDVMNPPFEVLDVRVAVGVLVEAVLLAVVVEVLVEVSIVGPCGEVETIGVTERWVVPSFERNFPVEVFNFAKTMRQTFQVVPSQDLLVHVVESLTTVVVLQIEFLAAHPEGIVQVVVIVERVETDIFHVVRKGLLRVQVEIMPGVVGVDDLVIILRTLLARVHLLVVLRLLDHLSTVEVVRVDLVDRRQREVVSVRTVDQGNRQRVHEHAFVDMVPGPNGSGVEGLVVVGIVEQLEQGDGLFQVFSMEHGEDLAPREKLTVLPVLVELFDYFRFLNNTLLNTNPLDQVVLTE
jgi:hypothetical protein